LIILITLGGRVQELLIMQLSPISCNFVPIWSKYSPQHPVLRHPTVYVLP
jgi:hypothetical protein